MSLPLADYHMHTRFSCDAEDSMEAMCQSAIDHGLNEIAFTEHFEGHPQSDFLGFYQPDSYFVELARCRELFAGQLLIRAGIEVGDPHRFPDKIASVVRAWPYDFVLGSVHWIADETPFGVAFFQQHEADWTYRGYFAEMVRMADADDFDVVAHIDMVKRQGVGFWGPFDPEPYADVLRETLKKLIARGKGIEINTSGWRNSAKEPCPALKVLRWYAELGGEILTIGSDCHRVAHVALRRQDAVELAREAGLRWLTTFDQRRPTQHPI